MFEARKGDYLVNLADKQLACDLQDCLNDGFMDFCSDCQGLVYGGWVVHFVAERLKAVGVRVGCNFSMKKPLQLAEGINMWEIHCPLCNSHWEDEVAIRPDASVESIRTALLHVRKLHLLSMLMATRSKVGDAELNLIRDLDSIRIIELQGTSITDHGLACLEDMRNLQFLFINETNVTDAAKKKFKLARPDLAML